MPNAGASELEGALTTHLTEAGFDVFWPKSEDLPTVVAAGGGLGLLVLDLVDHEDGALVELNRKLARLRNDVPQVARVRAQRIIVAPDAGASSDVISTPEDAAAGVFVRQLSPNGMDDGAVKAVAAYLAPRLSVDVPRRHPMSDEGAAARAVERLVLDAAQSDIACRHVDDVLHITGPPGSGKTLVLAARAKWLAAQDPNWRIVLLCYNRLLVPYLEALVWGHANITVCTFGQLTSRLRVRVSLDNEEWAEQNVAQALAHVKPVYDAVLVDEWQDFMDPWTRLVLATVRPGRGGLTVAGDPKQALYRDAHSYIALAGHNVEEAALHRPYRSTRQILEVTSALDQSMNVDGRADAAEGRPVDLVWAENVSELGAAVARDIELLLAEEERHPQDIAVLVTRKWDIGKVMYPLKKAGIPVRAVYPNHAEEFDLSESSVKVMTVHSSKGYEFDVVFLVGMEHLADPDGSDRAGREGRCGYVGSTRAKDQLVLTYSRENVYLDRIRSLPDSLVQPWVWPDDYPEVH
ncbi:3'-5' exonuclease [Microlunatus capsulatus]|uniref:DNA polymerase III delta prime subunit n=1 Tax=Microlunatus capsulatus TaxID=99117 RepID=A0ABS4Z7D8_9ACTN|nr:3'-5' exonuclease [Microlunatus capsulatus]MBP2416879.1 DNA polymerase III delta prime subunit [Microlunatus capsulatus]